LGVYSIFADGSGGQPAVMQGDVTEIENMTSRTECCGYKRDTLTLSRDRIADDGDHLSVLKCDSTALLHFCIAECTGVSCNSV